MRCASLVVFRQQPPRQIMQRKKAKESKTVCVPEQREWGIVCHSRLLYSTDHYSVCLTIIKSNLVWRSRLISIWMCLSSYKDSVNKRCSSPPNSTLQAKTPLPLSLLSLRLLVEGEGRHFRAAWNASPSPLIPCISLLSEQRASWGHLMKVHCAKRAWCTRTFHLLRKHLPNYSIHLLNSPW